MLGISYGELFLIVGAAAALVGPKDLPIIARTMGRLAGRAIGYVQVARGQFESVMQQSQARQVHKELQDTMAQLEAIRHEIRSISFMNPAPLSTKLVDNLSIPSPVSDKDPSKLQKQINATVERTPVTVAPKDHSSITSTSCDIHSQATLYERLAESASLDANSMNEVLNELTDESGQFVVLPVSAESAGLLPDRKDDSRGSDILLEAVLEEDVAHNSKNFFSQANDQKKNE